MKALYILAELLEIKKIRMKMLFATCFSQKGRYICNVVSYTTSHK